MRCVKCLAVKSKIDFYNKNKSTCKTCRLKKMKLYRRRPTVLERRSAYDVIYRGTHRTNRAKYQSSYSVKLKLNVIRAYGGKCACCGEKEVDFLTLDHIHGDGGVERKLIHRKGNRDIMSRLRREGFPKGRYRILCWNCNCSIGIRGFCPHGNL